MSVQKEQAILPVAFQKPDGPSFELEVTTRDALRMGAAEQYLSKPTRPGFHIIYHITRGHGTHTVDFEQHPVAPGSTVFICKGQVHAFDGSNALDGVLVLVTDGFLQKHGARSVALADNRLFNYHLYSPLLAPEAAQAEGLGRLFAMMLDEYAAKAERKEEVLHHLLELLLLKADRAKAGASRQQLIGRAYVDFMRFKEMVETGFRDSRKAEDYAGRMGRSLKGLNALCRTATGQTAKEYIDARTILEIRRHMSVRDKSVKELAFALGFDEPTNLVKYVKRLTGRTPGELG